MNGKSRSNGFTMQIKIWSKKISCLPFLLLPFLCRLLVYAWINFNFPVALAIHFFFFFLTTFFSRKIVKETFERTFQMESVFEMHSKSLERIVKDKVHKEIFRYMYCCFSLKMYLNLQNQTWLLCDAQVFSSFQKPFIVCKYVVHHSFDSIMVMEKFSIST